MKDYRRLKVKRLPKEVVVVSMNRPEKLNAVDLVMFKELVQVIKQLKKDRLLRVVILTAEGADFCSGIDLKAMMRSKFSIVSLLKKLFPGNPNLAQQVSYLWRTLPVPVISVVHGRCYGAGLQIILGTDFRILSEDAKLSIMESKWGLMPDMGGTLGLREELSASQAKYLAMTGVEIDAALAQSLGLSFKISDKPMEAALSLADELIQCSPDSVAAVKKLYNKAYVPNLRSVLALETWYQLKILFGRNRMQKIKMSQGKEGARFYKRIRW